MAQLSQQEKSKALFQVDYHGKEYAPGWKPLHRSPDLKGMDLSTMPGRMCSFQLGYAISGVINILFRLSIFCLEAVAEAKRENQKINTSEIRRQLEMLSELWKGDRIVASQLYRSSKQFAEAIPVIDSCMDVMIKSPGPMTRILDHIDLKNKGTLNLFDARLTEDCIAVVEAVFTIRMSLMNYLAEYELSESYNMFWSDPQFCTLLRMGSRYLDALMAVDISAFMFYCVEDGIFFPSKNDVLSNDERKLATRAVELEKRYAICFGILQRLCLGRIDSYDAPQNVMEGTDQLLSLVGKWNTKRYELLGSVLKQNNKNAAMYDELSNSFADTDPIKKRIYGIMVNIINMIHNNTAWINAATMQIIELYTPPYDPSICEAKLESIFITEKGIELIPQPIDDCFILPNLNIQTPKPSIDANLDVQYQHYHERELITYGKYPQTRCYDDNIVKKLKAMQTLYGGEQFELDGVHYVFCHNHWFIVEPIQWRVLERKDGILLLYAEKPLDALKFDSRTNDYEKSAIRKWLNGPFVDNAFAGSTQNLIQMENGDYVSLPDEKMLTNPHYGFYSQYDRGSIHTTYANDRWYLIPKRGYEIWIKDISNEVAGEVGSFLVGSGGYDSDFPGYRSRKPNVVNYIRPYIYLKEDFKK